MKNKIIKAAAIFCIASCITSCSQEEETTAHEGPAALQVSAGIGESLTRAVGTKWTASDAIGVRVTNATANSDMTTLYKNVKYTIKTLTSDKTTADFEAADKTKASTVIFFQDKSETATLAAYAPYSESEPNALPGTNGKITVETSKNNTSDKQESIDYIYAEGATASFTSPEAKFTKLSDTEDYSFHHKMARLVLTFKAGQGFNSSDILSTADDDVKFTFSLGGLIHEGTFDVTSGTAATTGTAVSDWDISECANTEVTTSGSETRTYTLILLPQDLSSSPLTLKATSGGQDYVNSKLIAPNLEAGKSYTYTITVNKTELIISGCTITDWTAGNGSGSDGVAE